MRRRKIPDHPLYNKLVSYENRMIHVTLCNGESFTGYLTNITADGQFTLRQYSAVTGEFVGDLMLDMDILFYYRVGGKALETHNLKIQYNKADGDNSIAQSSSSEILPNE